MTYREPDRERLAEYERETREAEERKRAIDDADIDAMRSPWRVLLTSVRSPRAERFMAVVATFASVCVLFESVVCAFIVSVERLR